MSITGKFAVAGILVVIASVSQHEGAGQEQNSEDQFRELIFMSDSELAFIGREWRFLDDEVEAEPARWPHDELTAQIEGMGDWLLATSTYAADAERIRTVAVHVVSTTDEDPGNTSRNVQNAEAVNDPAVRGDNLFTWVRLYNTQRPPRIHVHGILQYENETNGVANAISASREFVMKNGYGAQVSYSFQQL